MPANRVSELAHRNIRLVETIDIDV